MTSYELEIKSLVDEKKKLHDEKTQLSEKIDKLSLEVKDGKAKGDHQKKEIYRKYKEGQEKQEKLRDELDELRREKRHQIDIIQELERKIKGKSINF